MKKIAINFFNEDSNFKLKQINLTRNWINNTIESENYSLKSINFIFCSDQYLLKINQQYLHHDTFTDIITFDNSEIKKQIESDIFISIERVKENAKSYKVKLYTELHRIMIHGTLHLLGYKDKSPKQKELMTAKENSYLSKLYPAIS
ncbi:rRNA maturation factor [Pedobacter psychrophilus]|uniref:Endoribonuclease YbeY n=1 Tax=Pedobacter psychrophilus TaxID=1826909 RepID=A0A179DBF2_9SPHI|nr:rRNA maturation RNase YbeY [Pedobacter psychrophilus]OAQ38381.1 rRNA maturation factor [Pedobacter psychrophilus]